MHIGEAIVALVALSAMEIVLGIDNIVFLTIVSSRLPAEQRPLARRLGLTLALVFRILLLMTISYILKLKQAVFYLESLGVRESWFRPTDSERLEQWDQLWLEINGVSVRDLILLAGGLFLVAKSVHEIHTELEDSQSHSASVGRASFIGVLLQIGVLDIVFSLDSVITAVGMAEDLWVMITAVVLAVAVMIMFANSIGDFVERNPTIKMLALSFLILIGVMLVAEGAGTHVNKGYIYFAMAFALLVEMLNIRMRHVRQATATAQGG